MTVSAYNEPVAKQIGYVIRDKGLKQSGVAARAGLDEKALSDMLNGRRIIKARDIPAIARALGVTPNDLFEPHPSPTDETA